MNKVLTRIPFSAVVLASALMAVPSWGKKVKPSDFTTTATVVSVTSREEVSGIVQHHPYIPSYCKDQAHLKANPFDAGYCESLEAAPTRSQVKHRTVYTVTVDSGNTEYELQSNSLPTLGRYKVRISGGQMGFLSYDKKHHPHAFWYPIVAEHLKQSHSQSKNAQH